MALKGVGEILIAGFVANHDVAHMEFQRLPGQQVCPGIGRNGLDFEQVRVLAYDVQRLGSDGSGRSENGDASFH